MAPRRELFCSRWIPFRTPSWRPTPNRVDGAGQPKSIIQFTIQRDAGIAREKIFKEFDLDAQDQIRRLSQLNYFWFLIWHSFTSFRVEWLSLKKLLPEPSHDACTIRKESGNYVEAEIRLHPAREDRVEHRRSIVEFAIKNKSWYANIY